MLVDRSCVANRGGEGTALAEQMWSANGGRRGLFEIPFKRSSERNEFHSRADERLSAVEPQRLSRAEAVSLLTEIRGTTDGDGLEEWRRN